MKECQRNELILMVIILLISSCSKKEEQNRNNIVDEMAEGKWINCRIACESSKYISSYWLITDMLPTNLEVYKPRKLDIVHRLNQQAFDTSWAYIVNSQPDVSENVFAPAIACRSNLSSKWYLWNSIEGINRLNSVLEFSGIKIDQRVKSRMEACFLNKH